MAKPKKDKPSKPAAAAPADAAAAERRRYERDPISHFRLRTADYAAIARRIASLSLPTLIVMEGGYAVADLGANVASFLSGF